MTQRIISYSHSHTFLLLPHRMTSRLAEETGWHVGDGSMNYYRGKGFFQLRGHIIDDKDHYLTRIRQTYQNLFHLDVHIRTMPSSGVIGFQIWNTDLVSFKHTILQLPLGKKIDYHIPSAISRNKQFFFSFLRGLFDTDGCLYLENKRGKLYPRIQINTTLPLFCRQLMKLFPYYGLHATAYATKRVENNWRTIYTISVRGYPQVLNWMSLVGTHNKKHLEKLKKIK